jgi:transcription elongation factor Elf1
MFLDDKEISFKCPKCSHQLKKTVGWLKANADMICEGCGVTIKLNTEQLARGAEDAQKALDSIPKKITIKF